MKTTAAQLFNLLERLRDIPIVVVGDIILDRYIWGRVERVAQEAPVPIVDVRKEDSRLGGAANVARNLSRLGLKVSLCGYIGADAEGSEIERLLDLEKISREGVFVDRGRPTTLKTRIGAQNQHIVRFDREIREAPAMRMQEMFAAVVDAQLNGARAVVLSDYGKGVVTECLLARLDTAMESGRLSLRDRPLVVDPHATNYSRYRRMSIAKPNRGEAEAATGMTIRNRSEALMVASALCEKWHAGMVLLTLGDSGLVIAGEGLSAGVELDTVARHVYDVSGAGDTVTAVFTAAWCAGASAVEAGELANVAAGVVVSEVGTVAIDTDRLRAEISMLWSQQRSAGEGAAPVSSANSTPPVMVVSTKGAKTTD